MKKDELRQRLLEGEIIGDLFELSEGQECEIFKRESFEDSDEIIYIPDLRLNEIPANTPITDPDQIEEIILSCYTCGDFVGVCEGDVARARRLFSYCDWQHPSSALSEVDNGDEYED